MTVTTEPFIEIRPEPDQPKPLRGAAGRPLTQEQKDKMAAGRRASAARRGALKKEGRDRVARSSQPRPRPIAALPGGITAAARKKIIDLVGQLVRLTEGSTLFVAKRTPAPIPTRTDDEGKIVLAVTEAEAQAIAERHFARFDADRLEEWEIEFLSEALTDEMLRYPRLRIWLLRAVEMRDRGTLPTAVLVIALPRLVAHGMLPDEFAGVVSDLRDAARSARGAHRGHRDGKDDTGRGSIPNTAGDASPLRPGASV